MSIDNILYQEKVVFKALEELDERLYKMKCAPFTLNVVGGFAMMVEGIRMTDYTDIDYIGPGLPEKIKEIIDEIGIQYGLGRGWVNNDVLLSDNDLEDLECVTGPLEFRHALDMRVITVNSLSAECLLRMKVIAIDTSWSGCEFGGDFSRVKDFPDVKLLLDYLGISYNEMVQETFDYVECPDIYFLIRYYLRTNDIISLSDTNKCKEIIESKGK